MGDSIRIYKDDYDRLPEENKTVTVTLDDGSTEKRPGLSVNGAKEYLIDEIVLVENTESKSLRNAAKRIKKCENCGRISLINAKGLCRYCYSRYLVAKKANMSYDEFKEQRRKRIENREKEKQYKRMRKTYPYNLILDTFGDSVLDKFGDEFERFDDRHRQVLDAFLDSLPDKTKEIVKAKYEDGINVVKIAEDYENTRANIYLILKNVKLKLLANREAFISGDKSKLIRFKGSETSLDDAKDTEDIVKMSVFKYLTKDKEDFYSLFSKKTADLLLIAGISSLDELESVGSDKLAMIKGFGLQAIAEIEIALSEQRQKQELVENSSTV